jgi:hypothetical protein
MPGADYQSELTSLHPSRHSQNNKVLPTEKYAKNFVAGSN